jgi:hypothetical protein
MTRYLTMITCLIALLFSYCCPDPSIPGPPPVCEADRANTLAIVLQAAILCLLFAGLMILAHPARRLGIGTTARIEAQRMRPEHAMAQSPARGGLDER